MSKPSVTRILPRRLLRTVGRAALQRLGQLDVVGLDNLPAHGPLLLFGNHVDMLEAALLALVVPRPVEILGVGDIPLSRRADWLLKLYGAIPIRHSGVDRAALTSALGVLRHGGVVTLLPEGGLWDAGSWQARRRIAWLSQVAQAPVVPVGFGGLRGAVGRLARFEQPHIALRFGEPLPPVPRGANRKAEVERAAARMMDAVRALVPERELWLYAPGVGEQFDFDLIVTRPDGATRRHYDDFAPEERAALAKLLFHPTLLETLERRCGVMVVPLRQYATTRDPVRMAAAADAILDYLATVNDQFFHYRMGEGEGSAVAVALRVLRDIARRAASESAELALDPQRAPTLD